MIKILVLGGTQFIGRDLVETLMINENYSLSLANRGISNTNLFNNLCKLNIDRNNKETCSKLIDNEYDIVIDFSCYTETQFTNTIPYLRYKKYIYISTSATRFPEQIRKNYKNDPNYSYYINKIEAEEYVVNNIKNCVILRPPVVYGENDYTGRFYTKDGIFYWKNDNRKAGISSETIYVKDITKTIIQHLFLGDDYTYAVIVDL